MATHNEFTRLTNENRETVKAKSARALPNSPSDSGWSADQIRRKLYEAVLYLYDLVATMNSQLATALTNIENDGNATDLKLTRNKLAQTLGEATSILNGLMSATDKSHLDSMYNQFNDLATKVWVQAQGYITSASFDNYATKQWVLDKNYLTSITSLMITTALGYTPLREHQSLSGYATESWVENKGYLTQHQSLENYATKEFVNSSIATNTATFRGTSASGLTEQQFLAWANSLTKDNEDYVYWNTTDGVGNTLYKRYKYNGTQWGFEYSLNNSSFTSTQWSAINSGITSSLVSDINSNTSARHTHANASVINNITSQNIVNWNTAFNQNHTHSNKSVLDEITSDNLTNTNEKNTWNSKSTVSVASDGKSITIDGTTTQLKGGTQMVFVDWS